MALNLTWAKTTGIVAAQSAAHAALAVLGGNAVNAWHLDWQAILGMGGGAALISVLGSIAAYKLPDKPAAAVSAASLVSFTAPAPSDDDYVGKHRSVL